MNYTIVTILLFISLSLYVFAKSPTINAQKFNHDSLLGLAIIVSYTVGTFLFNRLTYPLNKDTESQKTGQALKQLLLINVLSILFLSILFYFFKIRLPLL